MADLIDRQAAIDLLRKRLIETANNNVGFTCDAGQVFEDASERIRYWIDELPSAQPEIIRCKDCKYSDEQCRRVSVRWLPCMDVRTESNWFCGSAERREG